MNEKRSILLFNWHFLLTRDIKKYKLHMLVIINIQDVIPAFRATRNMHEIRDTKYDNKRAIKNPTCFKYKNHWTELHYDIWRNVHIENCEFVKLINTLNRYKISLTPMASVTRILGLKCIRIPVSISSILWRFKKYTS